MIATTNTTALHAALSAWQRGEGPAVWLLTERGRPVLVRAEGEVPADAIAWTTEGGERWQRLTKAR